MAGIDALNKRIRYYPDKNGFLYSEANAFDNLKGNIIKLNYLEAERRKLTDYVYRVEVLNQRTDKVEGGFYATSTRPCTPTRRSITTTSRRWPSIPTTR